jgi:hypothetical protein
MKNIIENEDIKFIVRNQNSEKYNIIKYEGQRDNMYIVKSPHTTEDVNQYDNVIDIWDANLNNSVYNIVVCSYGHVIINDWSYQPNNYFNYTIKCDSNTTKKEDDYIIQIYITKYKPDCFIKYISCISNIFYDFYDFYYCCSKSNKIITTELIFDNSKDIPYNANCIVSPDNANPLNSEVCNKLEIKIDEYSDYKSDINDKSNDVMCDDFEKIDILEIDRDYYTNSTNGTNGANSTNGTDYCKSDKQKKEFNKMEENGLP